MNFRSMLSNLELALHNHAPAIFSGISIAGVISTAFIAHRDTLRAEDVIYEQHINPDDWKAIVKATWKCYIPTGVSVATTIGCIGGILKSSEDQKKVLSGAYLSSQAFIHEYQKKVIEKIGEKKERNIRDDTVQALADKKSPVANFLTDSKEAILTGHGHTLFFQPLTGEYFRSDINHLKTIENEINKYLINGYDTLFDENYIRSSLGLPAIPLGDSRGVDLDHMLEFKFVPELMDTGEVRVIVEYKMWPLTELRRR